MKFFAQQIRPGALALALVFLASATALVAQPATENSPPKPTAAEESAQQAELLKSYLKVREELHATQLAIVNNRVAGVTEKLDSIRLAMEAERERAQIEAQRAAAERERSQAESLRSNRTVLWVAAAFGGLGLIAVLLMPVLQWRTMNRMAEVATLRAAQLPAAGSGTALLGGGDATAPAEQAVTVSNQRLMAVIDRMERRIFELEHTTTQPNAASAAAVPVLAVASPVNTTNGTHANGAQTNVTLPTNSDPARRPAASSDQATWIAVLLNKGRSLISTNKALDAVTCYDEILRLDPRHTEAMIRKGAALERLNRFEEAIQCYERAIEIDNKATLAYLSKGGVCNRLGRYDDALKCYELALQAEEKVK